MSATAHDASRHSEEALESVIALNRVLEGRALAAPLAVDVIGSLGRLGRLLPLVLAEIATGMTRSLEQFDVYEDSGKDPGLSIMDANDHLNRAVELAGKFADELAKAQTAIATQRYRR